VIAPVENLKEQVVKQMEAYFGQDKRRTRHAHRVTAFAEQMLASEPAADSEVVIAAAVLHDIGIHAAEKKHHSTSGHYQEIEGPPIARRMLQALGLEESKIAEVCDIIAHHHTPGKIDSTNFRILYDSDWLVNLPDDYGGESKEILGRRIDSVFLTEMGRQMARQIYLDGNATP
jgi:HD superfamily phosphodiesterase